MSMFDQERSSNVEKWNPFRALSGIQQGLKVRKEYGERKLQQQGRSTGYFSAVAGREPTYRFTLSDSRENITAIESLDDAMDMLARVNRGRLSPDDLHQVVRLSPAQVVAAYPGISAEDLAHIHLLVRRSQALARQSTRPDPMGTVVDAHTAYYQQLPAGDYRRLTRGERWRPGDPNRPYIERMYEQYRRR